MGPGPVAGRWRGCQLPTVRTICLRSAAARWRGARIVRASIAVSRLNSGENFPLFTYFESGGTEERRIQVMRRSPGFTDLREAFARCLFKENVAKSPLIDEGVKYINNLSTMTN